MNFIENYLEKNKIIFFSLLLSIIVFVLYLFRNTGIICDEKENYQQILNFTNGDYRLLEISALPGYHACMAILSKLTGLSSLFAMRCITVIFGIISVSVFYLLALHLHPESTIIRTVQYLLFPAIFIFYFMLYTDILSLLLVMLMLLFALDKRFVLAGLFGILSMLVRQNNVLWVAFIPALIYYETFNWTISINKIISIIRQTWVFFICFALFIIFFIVNKGVAVGDASMHPAFLFSTGNVFFSLFCFFIFFLPMHVENIPKVFAYFKSSKWPLLISLFLFMIYWFTFKNDHPYNQIATYYFIRNYILVKFTSSAPLKFLFFLPMLYTFWSFVIIPLSKKSWNIFYFFTVFFLLPGWLIEQRYYIIPFVLFMLFRKEQSVLCERITILYYILILCLLLPAVVSLKLFL